MTTLHLGRNRFDVRLLPMPERPPLETVSTTVPQASKLSGLSRSTLYVLMSQGEIESFKHGRRRLIYYPSLVAWVEAQVAETTRTSQRERLEDVKRPRRRQPSTAQK
ncbi:MAG TPA: helix-turn-helix domain-containing protein [Thermomicrobiaceae bacterium]|nr:helix-turn-helix domain-containing protein [Thermomicrobiaceae bacterium]